MIYLFDKHKKLKGTVRARHTIALLYERERNGIYSVSAEIPVSLTDKRTVYNYHKKVKGSDFIGHYDREGRFQLHKIAAVDIENTSIFIKGIHLFFDEAKAGAIIRERRFRGREIIDGAREAFDPIGWSVVDFDTSVQKNYSFYNVSPLEARAILVETFGFEFDYWLDFDGKNLRNKQIAVKRKIGKETYKRYNYGHNVLSIKVEQDYSEIYTAVIGRGKGEDLDDSDGYGRRIEFTDIEWKKPSKPLDKAKGSRTLIDPNATQLFGYHDGDTVSPRTKVEIFSDIEDEAQLLQASYEWLMDNNVPKAVFSLNVPDGDGLDLGDSVHVIYRDIDLIKSTRVTKVIDDLVSGNRSVEFGDTAYFETDRRISGLKAELKRVGGSASSHIARLKAEFDRRFDEEVQQWKDDFEQALIDAEADVEAMRAEMTEEFEAAQKEFEEEFNQSVADAKEHADEAAEAKAKEVQDSLDSFSERHQQLYNEVTGDIMDIDTFIGDKSQTLAQQFADVESDFSGLQSDLLERINNIDTQSFNLIRGSRFDEVDRYVTSGGTIHDDEDMPYFRYGISSENIQYISTVDDIQLEAGKTYTLSLDYRTSSDVSIDYLRIIPADGSTATNIRDHIGDSDMAGIIPDGLWHRTFLTFTVPRNLTGNLRLGSDFTNGTKAQIDIRLPYLTTSGNTQWVFHPSDSYESIMSIMTRLDEFEARVQDDLAGVSSELSSAREALQAQLDDARATFDNLEVGGRNLILDSITPTTSGTRGRILDKDVDTPFGIHDIYCWTERVALLRYEVSPVPVNISEKYVLSFYAKTKNPGQEMNITIDISDEVSSTKSTVVTDEWQRFYTKAHKLDKGRLHADISLQSDDVPVYIAFWQLESGDKLTPWTPALEDTEEKITTISESIEYIDGQLEAKLNRTEIEPIQNKITEYGTTLDANAESIGLLQEKTQLHDDDIDQWSNQATTTAEEVSRILTHNSEQDGLITSVTNESRETAEGLERTISRVSETESGLERAQLDIDMNADKLSLTMTRDEFEGATAGMSGRNLLLNTPTEETEFNFSGWNGNTWRVPDYLKDEMVAGGDFTASIDFKDIQTSHGVGLVVTFRNNSGGAVRQLMNVDEFYQTGDEGRYIYSLNIPPITGDVAYVEVSLRNGSSGEVSSGIMSRLMFNKGIKALPYSPAPEDIQADITQLNTDINIEAGKIETLISKTELHGGDITQWSNETEANAESIRQTLTRVEETESGISQAQTDIQTNADGIAGVISDVEMIDGNLSSLTTNFNVEAGKIETLISKTDGHDTQLTNIVADYEKIEQTVAKNDDWLGIYGSAAEQTIEGFEQRVWNTDITNVNPNLIPWADVSNPNSAQYWKFWPASNITSFHIDNFGEYVLRSTAAGATLGIMSDVFPEKITAGEEYTLSMITRTSDDWNSLGGMAYTYLINENGTNQGLGAPSEYIQLDSSRRRNIWRFTANFSGDASVMVGTYRINADQDARFSFKEPKLEVGSTWTPFMRAFSNIEQQVNMIEMRVFEELDGGYVSQAEFEITTESLTQRMSKLDGSGVLTQSDIKVFDDSIILGSQEVSSEHFASILAISPSAIDMITDELNLTGNLNVKGQIESLAVSAVKASFGEVVAGTADIQFIQAKHLASDSIQSRHLYVNNAMAEKLIANSVMSSEIKTLSLDAVEANIGSIRSKILTSNVVQSSHIASGTALIDKIFSSNAMFSRMMSKNGFVTTLNTVTIDTDQLTIRRPDGVAWVSQGLARGHVPVQIFDNYADSSVQFSGLNFVTSSSFWKNFKYFYTPHEGSRLRVVWAVSLQTGNSASEYIEVGVNGFGNYNPINNGTGSSTRRQLVYAGQTEYITQDIPLPPPNFQTFQANLQFRRSPTGVHLDNRVTVRILHIGQYD